MHHPKVLYERDLPGGGFVQVEEPFPDDVAGEHRVQLAVERRSDPLRRVGHAPPVIAALTGRSLASLVRHLVTIAADNVEVAKGLLRRAGGRPKF